MIELRNIKKYYKMGDNVVKALDDVSLKVEDGEFVTIIGPSGSGKSTLMNIIGCLDKATSGSYLIDGIEVSNYTENQLAYLRNKKMGFIFQGFNLLQNLSAYENVDLPLIYQGLSLSERKERVNKSLKLVGMSERMKHKPSELSGGQQQRVAIARALATMPMCILADEPTGNLDSVTGEEIMKILKNLNKNGTTVIIITHNDDIAKLSRRVVRIHDGKIESDIVNENIKSYGDSIDESLEDNSFDSCDENSQIQIEENPKLKEKQEQIEILDNKDNDEKLKEEIDSDKIKQVKTVPIKRKKDLSEKKVLVKSKKSSRKEEL